MVKVTIIYDNTAFDKTLEADWEFAALIEAYGRTLLFDAGPTARYCCVICAF